MSDIFSFKIQKYLSHKKIDYPEARLNDHLMHTNTEHCHFRVDQCYKVLVGKGRK